MVDRVIVGKIPPFPSRITPVQEDARAWSHVAICADMPSRAPWLSHTTDRASGTSRPLRRRFEPLPMPEILKQYQPLRPSG